MLALKDTVCRIETGASSSTYFVYLVAAIKSVYFETNETSGMFVVHEEFITLQNISIRETL